MTSKGNKRLLEADDTNSERAGKKIRRSQRFQNAGYPHISNDEIDEIQEYDETDTKTEMEMQMEAEAEPISSFTTWNISAHLYEGFEAYEASGAYDDDSTMDSLGLGTEKYELLRHYFDIAKRVEPSLIDEVMRDADSGLRRAMRIVQYMYFRR